MKLRSTLFIKQIVLLRVQPLYGSTPCFAFSISRLIPFCLILKSNPKSNYVVDLSHFSPFRTLPSYKNGLVQTIYTAKPKTETGFGRNWFRFLVLLVSVFLNRLRF